MKTKQPKWKCIAQLGDVNPVEHGGIWVFEDQTKTYSPEIEMFEPETGTLSRFQMDGCTHINGILSDNKFHPEKEAWFADRISAVAESVGKTESELILMLCHPSNIIQRAHGWLAIVGYFGVYELDQYPIKLKKAEAKNRYGRKTFQPKTD